MLGSSLWGNLSSAISGHSSIFHGHCSSPIKVTCPKAWWWCCIQDVWITRGPRPQLSAETLSNCWPYLGCKDQAQTIVHHQQRGQSHHHDPSSKSMLQRSGSGFKSTSVFLRSLILFKETKQHTDLCAHKHTHLIIKRINTGIRLCCKPRGCC